MKLPLLYIPIAFLLLNSACGSARASYRFRGCAASRWCNFSACADNLIATNSSANSANLLYGQLESVAIFRLCSEIGHLRKQKSCFIV